MDSWIPPGLFGEPHENGGSSPESADGDGQTRDDKVSFLATAVTAVRTLIQPLLFTGLRQGTAQD